MQHYLPHLQGIRDPKIKYYCTPYLNPVLFYFFFSNTNFTSTFYIQTVNNMWKILRERGWTPLHMFLFGLEMTFSGNFGFSGDLGEFEGIEWFGFSLHIACTSLPIFACFEKKKAVFTSPVRTHRVYNVRINNQPGSNNHK